MSRGDLKGDNVFGGVKKLKKRKAKSRTKLQIYSLSISLQPVEVLA